MSSKHLCAAEWQEEIDQTVRQAVEENNKRYQGKKPRIARRQEINEHIFGTIKDNGV
jgi:hypothetical protein